MLLPPFHSLALPTAAHGEPSNMLGQRGSLNKKKKNLCTLIPQITEENQEGLSAQAGGRKQPSLASLGAVLVPGSNQNHVP